MITKMRSILLIFTLATLSLGKFQLNYPAARGYDEGTLDNFPCGGQNTVSSNRTSWTLDGSPIQLNLEEQFSNVEVFLALGDSPGSNFDYILENTFSVSGLGKYCIGNVTLPQGLNITDGSKGTIQVVTNNDGFGGGLYNCADVIFTTDTVSGSQCTNDTGILEIPHTGAVINANTSSTAKPSGGDGGSGNGVHGGSDSASGSVNGNAGPRVVNDVSLAIVIAPLLALLLF